MVCDTQEFSIEDTIVPPGLKTYEAMKNIRKYFETFLYKLISGF